VEEAVEEAGGLLHHREGTHLNGWMLLDFGDLIVHLFGPDERDYYNLEQAWPEAQEVVRIQ
jgi:ribosome-associated protein